MDRAELIRKLTGQIPQSRLNKLDTEQLEELVANQEHRDAKLRETQEQQAIEDFLQNPVNLDTVRNMSYDNSQVKETYQQLATRIKQYIIDAAEEGRFEVTIQPKYISDVLYRPNQSELREAYSRVIGELNKAGFEVHMSTYRTSLVINWYAFSETEYRQPPPQYKRTNSGAVRRNKQNTANKQRNNTASAAVIAAIGGMMI